MEFGNDFLSSLTQMSKRFFGKGTFPGKKARTGKKKSTRTAFQAMRGRVRRGTGVGNFALSNLRTGGLMGVETKFFDTGIGLTAISNAAAFTGAEMDPAAQLCLNAVAQNDTASGRDGNKINMKGISIRGVVQWPAWTDNSGPVMGDVFIALVLDTQTNGAQAQSEEVFTNPGAVISLVTSPFREMSQVTRFRVLKEKRLLAPTGLVVWNDTGSQKEQLGYCKHFEMYVSLKSLLTNYKGTTSVIASLADNSLHLIAVTNQAQALGTPSLGYNSRLRFVG